jgi:hypothetical protein
VPSSLELVPLKCRQCGGLIDGETNDVVFYCTHCSTGYELVDDDLQKTEVRFVSYNGAAKMYLPFWALNTRVHVKQRVTSSGKVGAFFGKLFGGQDITGRTVDLRFYVPAFHLDMSRMRALSLKYTEEQPELGELLGEKLTHAVYTKTDAERFARYVFVSIEAEKSDTLKHLDYELTVENAWILGVPFVEDKGVFKDAIFGMAAQ